MEVSKPGEQDTSMKRRSNGEDQSSRQLLDLTASLEDLTMDSQGSSSEISRFIRLTVSLEDLKMQNAKSLGIARDSSGSQQVTDLTSSLGDLRMDKEVMEQRGGKGRRGGSRP